VRLSAWAGCDGGCILIEKGGNQTGGECGIEMTASYLNI